MGCRVSVCVYVLTAGCDWHVSGCACATLVAFFSIVPLLCWLSLLSRWVLCTHLRPLYIPNTNKLF